MFERFTDNLRRAFAEANRIAQDLNHEKVGLAHLLLGILKVEKSLAVATLVDLGIDLENLETEIRGTLTKGPEMVVMGKLPLTDDAKKAVQFALHEARVLKVNYVGTEHFFSALCDLPSVVGGVLVKAGLTRGVFMERAIAISRSNVPQHFVSAPAPSLSSSSSTTIHVFSIILAPEMEWTMAKLVELQLAFETRANEATVAGRRLEARTFTGIAEAIAKVIREEFGAEEQKE